MSATMTTKEAPIEPDLGFVVDSSKSQQHTIASCLLFCGSQILYNPLVPQHLMHTFLFDPRGRTLENVRYLDTSLLMHSMIVLELIPL